MDREDIINAIKAMTYKDRKELVHELAMAMAAETQSHNRKEKRRRADRRGKHLVEVMNAILDDDCTNGSRRRTLCYARTIIAVKMWKEGFTEMQIGRVINRKSCSVNLLKKAYLDYEEQPMMFADYFELQDQFLKAI